MAWLEHVSTNLPSLLYNSILTLIIAGSTAGLAWGIRPAIQFLLDRVGLQRHNWGATLVQVVIILGGMVLLVLAVGINALLFIIAVGLAFMSGLSVGGETVLTDRIAAIRIRKLYRVGDVVTLGNDYRGVVRRIGRTETHLEDPGQSTVIVRNSAAVRYPIVIHQQGAVATNLTPGKVEFSQQAIAAVPAAAVPTPVVSTETQDATMLANASRSADSVAESDGDLTDNVLDREVTTGNADHFHLSRRLLSNPHAVPLAQRVVLGKRTIRDLR
ncbi:MAG: hypothetical protein R2932_29260 [Caldilineaceae bacterium]